MPPELNESEPMNGPVPVDMNYVDAWHSFKLSRLDHPHLGPEDNPLTAAWQNWMASGSIGPRPPFDMECFIVTMGFKPIPAEWYETCSVQDFLRAEIAARKYENPEDGVVVFRSVLNKLVRRHDGPTFRSLRWTVLERAKHTCQSCGRKAPAVPIHVDHIIPVASGGATTLENLQALCEDCNLGKSGRHMQQQQ